MRREGNEQQGDKAPGVRKEHTSLRRHSVTVSRRACDGQALAGPPGSDAVAENLNSVTQNDADRGLPSAAEDVADGEAQREAWRRWREICLPGCSGLAPELETSSEPPDSEPIPDDPKSVTQKERDRLERVSAALVDRRELFVRQGAVVATWRPYKGQRLGPYYRIVYREDGRPRSIYLGASAWLARQVRSLLTRLQTPLRESRALKRVLGTVRASLRRHQRQAKSLFARLGVRLRGFEYRGLLRYLRETARQRDAAARERRIADAWRVITGADHGGDGNMEVGSRTGEGERASVSHGPPLAPQSAA